VLVNNSTNINNDISFCIVTVFICIKHLWGKIVLYNNKNIISANHHSKMLLR